MTARTASLIGAGLGLAFFLAVGLLPAALYGGYAGVMLATGIFATPLMPTLPVQGLIIFGILLGVVAVASLMLVAGAAIASIIHTIVGGVRVRRLAKVPVTLK
jgi:hypothetical protein